MPDHIHKELLKYFHCKILGTMLSKLKECQEIYRYDYTLHPFGRASIISSDLVLIKSVELHVVLYDLYETLDIAAMFNLKKKII